MRFEIASLRINLSFLCYIANGHKIIKVLTAITRLNSNVFKKFKKFYDMRSDLSVIIIVINPETGFRNMGFPIWSVLHLSQKTTTILMAHITSNCHLLNYVSYRDRQKWWREGSHTAPQQNIWTLPPQQNITSKTCPFSTSKSSP